ncbi:MAG: hypothetical protein CBB92_14810 [Flammeovirgaceae bacterium TMED32]|nr:MAG: hypothetical protein CBB92_14810 [Flammeovirgaceae bacterium TMED32]
MSIEAQSVEHLENWFRNGFNQIFDDGYEVEDVLWADETGKPSFQINKKTELRAIVDMIAIKDQPNNLVLLLPPLIIKDFESNNN